MNKQSNMSQNKEILKTSKVSFSDSQVEFKKKITVYFGSKHPKLNQNHRFGNNFISTTKYSPITFIPMSLMIQFKRPTNLYFLIVIILTCLPYTPKNPASMIGTFGVILLATMIKEGYEDFSRYKDDKLTNKKEVLRLDNHEWIKVESSILKAGDLVKINKNEVCPADIIILKSSSQNGYCYIDSKNLDGESHLKEKMALEEFKSYSNSELIEMKGSIECSKSDENLHSWEGHMYVMTSKLFPSINNMILNGCTLKNTKYIIGVIVYCGTNSKVMKNFIRPSLKVSKVIKMMNQIVYILFYFHLFICFLLSALSAVFFESRVISFSYIFPNYDPNDIKNNFLLRFLLAMLNFFIAYSPIIPISLYVALEFVKIIQGQLIYYDSEMCFGEIASESRNTDLTEELGQIEYFCTDKTGTLTQNKMLLKKICVNGIVYDDINRDITELDNKLNVLIPNSNSHSPKTDLKSEDTFQTKKLEEFLYLLTLCHSLYIEKSGNDDISYHGDSADEIALVQGAKKIGIELKAKEFSEITIKNNIKNEIKKYELKLIIPFDSERRRMTVVVLDKDIGQYIILCKGADSEIINRIIFTNSEEESFIVDTINNFSSKGLRILVMARRNIDTDFFDEWLRNFMSEKSKGGDLNKFYQDLEKDFLFSGIVGIEDRLQEGVEDAITTILSCGIKIWVLTGDKPETTKEIAKKCKIINEKTLQIVINCKEKEKILNEMYSLADEYSIDLETNIDFELCIKKVKRKNDDQNMCIIVDGVTLEYILDNYECAKILFILSYCSQSVLFCRVSPRQKAKVIKLIKLNGNWISLAIGDGSNDVPMLMESHIGVGLINIEDGHAYKYADFSIGQFRFIEKLLLIYGRNGYIKISRFICYYFYKNIMLVFTEFYFSSLSGYSGQIFFADYLTTLFNALWTSWPCIFTFSLEKNLNLVWVKKFPLLYDAGQKNYYFNIKIFCIYILSAIFQSYVSFLISVYGTSSSVSYSGMTVDHWNKSTLCFSIIIHIVNFKLLLMTDYWNFLNISAIILSIMFYYLSLLIISTKIGRFFQPELYGVIFEIMMKGKFWMIIIVGPLIAIIPDITIKLVYMVTNANPLNTLILKVKDPIFSKKFDNETDKRHNSIDRKQSQIGVYNYSKANIFLKKTNNTDYATNHDINSKSDEMISSNSRNQIINFSGRGLVLNGVNQIKSKDLDKMKLQENFASTDTINRKIGCLTINEDKKSKTISKVKNKCLIPFHKEIVVPKSFPKDTLGFDNYSDSLKLKEKILIERNKTDENRMNNIKDYKPDYDEIVLKSGNK